QAVAQVPSDPMMNVYKLHGQTRRYQFTYTELDDGRMLLEWGIERNTKWQSGSFLMTAEAVEAGDAQSFLMPEDGRHVELPSNETYAMISRLALRQLRANGNMLYNGLRYHLLDSAEHAIGEALLHVKDDVDGSEMWILGDSRWPRVWRMAGNPFGQNWQVRPSEHITCSVAAELRMCPDKAGSIYYAYQAPEASDASHAPLGFQPFYVSHYGRHGSRWITDDSRYRAVIDAMENDTANLTPLGLDVYHRLLVVWDDARGHGGELTPLGNRQHHDIAVRLSQRLPQLFGHPAAGIIARSSTAGRCMMSMAAFCDGLKEQNPKLNITREASARDMEFIVHNTPEAKYNSDSDDAPWRAKFRAFEDSVLHPERLVSTLFIDPSKVANHRGFMEGLYWIAVDMQNVEPDVSFYDVFTHDELYNIWQTINYRMYEANVRYDDGKPGPGPESARVLLQRIVADADKAVAADRPSADLRFGHDTNLIRLLALMQADIMDYNASNPDTYKDAWQDFRVSPMAANLQMIFYRNKSGDIIVQLLHNERDIHLPVKVESGPFYSWNALREYLMAR
ncbi:MAG: histidine phosphatase family protein, partial [Muribaculaceae bacterium]|nr:histidine phosphatase family protein [Muribaculaceae bacterium]